MKDSLSVIVPVYGEKELVAILYNRLVSVLKNMNIDYKIIYINDADPHGCDMELEKIAAIDKNIVVINFIKNFGEEYAVKAGIDYCNSDYAIIMDCDLQDKPEDIPFLYKKAKEGYNIVWGERAERIDSLKKKLCSNLFYLVFNFISDIKIEKKIGSFSIISRNVVNALKKNNKSFFNYIQDVKSLGFDEAYIPIQKGKRPIGTSSYTIIKSLQLAIKILITYQSRKLLYAPIIISWILCLIGFVSLFILINSSINFSFSFLLKLITFIFMIIFINISFISLYILKIVKQNTTPFQYIIKNIISN